MALKRKSGVTLLEIMISVFIISIAFLAILRVVQFGGRSTVRINNYEIVARIGQGLIEECRHVPLATYNNDYEDLLEGQWFTVRDDYIPKTLSAVASYSEVIKDLRVTASLTVKIDDETERISEIWLRVLGMWTEGDTPDQVRQIRLSNAIHTN